MKKLTLLVYVVLASLLPQQAAAFGISFGDASGMFGSSRENNNSIDVGKVWDALQAGKNLYKGFEDLTPEQEYYLGRGTAATLLNRFKPVNPEPLHHYLNSLVQYLIVFSDRPETFSGYRVQLVDNDQALAYSAPGGFIIISTGLLKRCSSEDELASVLAHEIAHIGHKDGLAAIKTSNLTEAGKILGGLALGSKGNYRQTTAMLKTSFGGSVDDIVGQLVESGYSRSQETEADKQAALILVRAGYRPQALSDFLSKAAVEPEKEVTIDPDHPFEGISEAFNVTHPGGQERIDAVDKLISGWKLSDVELNEKRAKRFSGFMQR